MLLYGLTNFDTVNIAKKNENIGEIEVWQGKKKTIKAYINKDLYKTIPKARKKYLKIIMNYEGPVKAPIKKNDVIGTLKIFYNDDLLEEYNLLAFENVDRVNIFSRILSSINYLIWGDV